MVNGAFRAKYDDNACSITDGKIQLTVDSSISDYNNSYDLKSIEFIQEVQEKIFTNTYYVYGKPQTLTELKGKTYSIE